MRKIWILLLVLGITFAGCDQVMQDVELTEEEITQGLKTALTYGADSSSTELSQEDGYYANPMLKILLPEEAQPMLKYVEIIEKGAALFSTIATLTGTKFEAAGEGYIEQTIMSINRSAEEAAKEAKPIFVDAITEITIEDGLNILQGKSDAYQKTDFDSIAATQYLKYKTFTPLTDVYAPKIDAALDKVVLDFGDKTAYTTNQLWHKLIVYYNNAITVAKIGRDLNLFDANTELGRLAGEAPINAELSLGQFATGKALDGLFWRVGVEEKKIRKNPFQWASDILDKVFGYVYVEPDGTTDK